MKILALLATLIALTQQSARAQDPTILVVGFSPGGTSSIAAHVIANSLSIRLRETVVVENKAGVGGAVAAEYVARSGSDKTYLFLSSNSIVRVSPSLGLVPVGIIATFPYAQLIQKKHRNLRSFLEVAKVDSKIATFGSAGVASVAHLLAAKLLADVGLDAVHVPYKGSADVVAAVLGGHIGLASVPAPDIPAGSELIDVAPERRVTDGWVALFAPPNVSAASYAAVSTHLSMAIKDAAGALETHGFAAHAAAAPELQQRYMHEHALWLQEWQRFQAKQN